MAPEKESKLPGEQKPHRPLQVLSVGLPRTGSFSICLALEQLGYKDVYHCMHTLDNPEHWMFFGAASDRLFPSLPSYNGQGMTATEWDELFGPCEAITDIAGPFAESLIESFPDAKVILVERPFDRWEPSARDLFRSNFGWIQNFVRDWVEPMTRPKGETSYVENLQKMLLGFTRSRDCDEIVASLGSLYERHNEGVKRMVPSDRLLLYRLGSGWEPLCEFLGKEVPGVPFPHGNEGAALRKTIWDKQVRTVKKAAPRIALYFAGFVLVAVASRFLLTGR